MRHFPSRSTFRTALVLLLACAVLAASGCSWFRRNSPYNQSAETRPLEVPPDLDRPNTDAALGTPSSVTRSAVSAAAPAAANTGFTVAGERDAVFARVGEALAATPGVTIASKAELLGAYDVSYEGSNFLVRVTPVDAGIYVSAVDPRGAAASGEAPAKLIAAIKAALGG